MGAGKGNFVGVGEGLRVFTVVEIEVATTAAATDKSKSDTNASLAIKVDISVAHEDGSGWSTADNEATMLQDTVQVTTKMRARRVSADVPAVVDMRRREVTSTANPFTLAESTPAANAKEDRSSSSSPLVGALPATSSNSSSIVAVSPDVGGCVGAVGTRDGNGVGARILATIKTFALNA